MRSASFAPPKRHGPRSPIRPEPRRPIAKSGQSSRNEDPPVGKKKRSSLVSLLVVGCALGSLCLLLVLGGAGFAIYWYAVRDSEATPSMTKAVPDVPRDEPAPVAPPAAEPAPSGPLAV